MEQDQRFSLKGDSMDALALQAVTSELRGLIVPSLVRRIHEMPGRSFLFNLWSGKEQWLLIVLEGEHRRIHLVGGKASPSAIPSAFCMFLRKHLEGLTIQDIIQPELERCVVLRLGAGKNSARQGKRLVVELLGKSGNMLVLDEDERILRNLNVPHPSRISAGGTYIPPQRPAHKRNPREIASLSQLRDALIEGDDGGSLEASLRHAFFALNEVYVREIMLTADLEGGQRAADLSGDEWSSLFDSWHRFWARIDERRLKPVISGDGTTGTSPWGLWPYMEYGESPCIEYPTVNRLLEELYGRPEQAPGLAERKEQLLARALGEVKKLQKRMIALTRDLEKAHENHHLKEWGELLLLNLGSMEKGAESVEVDDIFAEEARRIVIPLESRLSPSENATHYFDRFKKARRAVPILTSRIEETKVETAFWQDRARAIEEAVSLEAMERMEAGREPTKQRAREVRGAPPDLPSGPRRFLFKSYEIIVGKNPRQNDEISLKIARPDDLWFHAHGMPSAHVILRCGGGKNKESLPQEALVRAATVAAHFSRAKNSTKVPVVYTRAKYVRKTRHMHPGMVTISKEHSIIVNPLDSEFLEWLKAQ
jgi:predicted ribosome quality control (RQC) complex YloA/Tae2 family protein